MTASDEKWRERIVVAESKLDQWRERIAAAEQRAQAAESERDALRAALSHLRQGCLNLGGTTCRLCLGTWIASDGEQAEDHHEGCPMRATAGRALLRAAEGGERDA